MDRDIRLEVRSDPRLLGTVRSLVRGWAEGHGIAPDVVHEVVLAVDEAFSNAIRHSYRGSSEHTVELTLQSAPDELEFQVCDHGVSCPPEHRERRALTTPDHDELRPGGLGVQLMYQVFDEVRFECGEEGGNSIVMRLKRPR